MREFRQHDNGIVIHGQRYPLVWWSTLEPDYGLPAGMVSRLYRPEESLHLLFDGVSQFAGDVPWSAGEVYLDQAEQYAAAWAQQQIRPSSSIDYAALKTELENDPAELGYATLSPAQAADLLNVKRYESAGKIAIADLQAYVHTNLLWIPIEDATTSEDPTLQTAARMTMQLMQARYDNVDSSLPAFGLCLQALSAHGLLTAGQVQAVLNLGLRQESRGIVVGDRGVCFRVRCGCGTGVMIHASDIHRTTRSAAKPSGNASARARNTRSAVTDASSAVWGCRASVSSPEVCRGRFASWPTTNAGRLGQPGPCSLMRRRSRGWCVPVSASRPVSRGRSAVSAVSIRMLLGHSVMRRPAY